MSLYTPVFPSVHESDRVVSSQNASTAAPGKRHSYIELLRDVHLFLSTKNDVLCPPSRPSSPLFDRRVQKVRDDVQDIFNATGGDTSNGQWTRINQTLKLGCMRGKYRLVPDVDPCVSDEDADWILPDEESEWFEWEKKREESRRLRAKTNASQGIGSAVLAPHDSLKPNHASVADMSQPSDKVRERDPREVSPTTLRVAKDKVRQWQASVSSEVWHVTPNSSSTRATVGTTTEKGQVERSQRTRTLDFSVVKSAAKSAVSKGGKGSLSRLAIHGGSNAPRGSIVPVAPGDLEPIGICKASPKQSSKTSHTKGAARKIGDIPESPYLPPSFPTHLETSTPLPDPLKLVRAKPSPILPFPTSSSTPPLPALADPPGDLVPAVPHAANVSSSLLPQIDNMQSGKRARELSLSLDSIPDDTRATPSAKRLQTLPPNFSDTVFKHTRPISPIGGNLDLEPGTRDDASDPHLGAALSHQTDTHGVTSAAPLTPREDKQDTDAQNSLEKLPSPTKSVKSTKSYFSTPDSDSADSPMKVNLLLDSPVSPMLSYARNPSGFLPQMTSTQVAKGSPTVGRTNSGVFGAGYSSQFDVERQVDHVNELLAKDVDFEGWLRDVRAEEDQ